ncbi:hypothetical protein [Pseudomaricurvus sp.]|uniref:hypothetical protein n=1 Tax=Pseudomaricurvus sp. TaxID=2004510 RepID=UPI003F6AAC2F
MTSLKNITKRVNAEDRFDTPYAERLHTQLEAANELFQDKLHKIKLLSKRAETADIRQIKELSDIVPLLFAHTTYKSYPENWLTEGQWDRMGKWLQTLSATPVEGIDTDSVSDLDGWLKALENTEHFVSCSSGTTGKCSMINASMADRHMSRANHAAGFEWATGCSQDNSFKIMGVAPVARSVRNDDSRDAIANAFGNGSDFQFPCEPITVGRISHMVSMRRAIADGTAKPEDVAEFEATSARRAKDMNEGVIKTAEALIESRGEKLLICGMFSTLYQVAELVREKGYSGKDFSADNAMLVGGGLKGANLPDNYREYILETFNIPDHKIYQYYGMQELNTTMPRCSAGRYHVPPWIILLLLDQGGDNLITETEGEVEGRAGFLDLSVEGRWGGVISGDKIKVNYGQCECGAHGPSINSDIVRYSDLPGGDKISCSGTIDAYVRGAS